MMIIKFSGKTDRGKVRKKNEDCLVMKRLGEDEYIFIVADGMGGHLAGEVASKMGCEVVVKGMKEGNRKNPFALLSELFDEANKRIFTAAMLDPLKAGMGTTLTALYLKGNQAYIAHVGDSRAYWIKKNRITRLTLDHSLVEKMLREGALSLEEAKNHPKKNILYQSVGVYGNVEPQLVGPLTIKEGEVLVLSTDGLTTYIEEDEIKQVAKNLSPDMAVKRLIDISNERGGGDNITVILIKFPEESFFEGTIREREGKFSRIIDLASLIFTLILILTFLLGTYGIRKKAERLLSPTLTYEKTGK